MNFTYIHLAHLKLANKKKICKPHQYQMCTTKALYDLDIHVIK